MSKIVKLCAVVFRERMRAVQEQHKKSEEEWECERKKLLNMVESKEWCVLSFAIFFCYYMLYLYSEQVDYNVAVLGTFLKKEKG